MQTTPFHATCHNHNHNQQRNIQHIPRDHHPMIPISITTRVLYSRYTWDILIRPRPQQTAKAPSLNLHLIEIVKNTHLKATSTVDTAYLDPPNPSR